MTPTVEIAKKTRNAARRKAIKSLENCLDLLEDDVNKEALKFEGSILSAARRELETGVKFFHEMNAYDNALGSLIDAQNKTD